MYVLMRIILCYVLNGNYIRYMNKLYKCVCLRDYLILFI